ncbi:MAG: hypothetical protein SNJ69_15690, partial [Chloroflexaceae bacterium]
LQRLIAATQRASLPRGCMPAERLRRLRTALCRRAYLLPARAMRLAAGAAARRARCHTILAARA